MREIDIQTWDRKAHYNFFKGFQNPNFAVAFKVDLTKAYEYSKAENLPLFAVYLHSCMRAINDVEHLRLRITEDDRVVDYEMVHASATILRPNKTFGFSFINFHEDLKVFIDNFEKEKQRILNSDNLFPPVNSRQCIHCSAMPWVDFIGHKEPFIGESDSVPKLGFSKITTTAEGSKSMTVSITVNHALVDGYHLGQFNERFQEYLNAY